MGDNRRWPSARFGTYKVQQFVLEDGTVTNGFGACIAGLVQTVAAETRVVPLGAPDRTYEHAPRAQQLAEVGLTGAGIAARVRALAAEQSLTHS